jgi:hypothetical protein
MTSGPIAVTAAGVRNGWAIRCPTRCATAERGSAWHG